MSGWGEAENMINKLVFECDDQREARALAEYARTRPEMKYVNVCMDNPMPRYLRSERYYAQLKTRDEYPMWYTEAEKIIHGTN